MVLVQKLSFFQPFFFLGNIGQENVFYDIVERKNGLLGYKNKKFKKLINWQFSRGDNPGFWSKYGHFSNFFFLGNISQENVLHDILEQKKILPGYKNLKFKTSKNRHFSKGVNRWFWSKNGHFSQLLFFLRNLGHKNIFYDILERKNALLGYKDKKFKKTKNWDFSKGINPGFWSKNGHFSQLF